MSPKLLLLTFFVSVQFLAGAPDNVAIAKNKGKKAYTLLDYGHPGEAIKLLEECVKLDPASSVYPYEIGYAYYISKDYKKTIMQLALLLKRDG